MGKKRKKNKTALAWGGATPKQWKKINAPKNIKKPKRK